MMNSLRNRECGCPENVLRCLHIDSNREPAVWINDKSILNLFSYRNGYTARYMIIGPSRERNWSEYYEEAEMIFEAIVETMEV